MYSKEALDLYESMLNKVTTKEAGIPGDILGHLSGMFNKIKGLATNSSTEPLKTYTNVFKKEAPELLRGAGLDISKMTQQQFDALSKGVAEKFGPHIAEKAPWLSVAAAGIPLTALGAGYVGHNIGGAQKEWDQTKAGLTGLAAGLALPTVYSALTGRSGLKGINNPFSGNANQSAISDFTSI